MPNGFGQTISGALKRSARELGIFVLLLVLCFFTQWKSGGAFFGADNMQNMARLVGMYGIFGIGSSIVIITGGIDLTVGSLQSLFGVMLSILLVDHKVNPLVAVLTVVLTGCFLGLIHGLLITRVKLQAFIVTLCGFLFYRGLSQYVAHDETKGFGDGSGFSGLMDLASGSIHGVPTPFVLLVILSIIFGILLHKSVYGRYLYAVGRNEDAARYSGIQTKWVITFAYVIAGLLTATSAILFAFYTNSISPSSHGQTYEMYGIAAAVLGGCSTRGGEGSIVGMLLGTILLQVLQNLVNLLGIQSSLNFAVVGAVILIGVVADRLLNRKAYAS